MATNNYLDKTGLGLVWAKIKLLLADKVDKVDGKGLSSNDYTSDEKAKLANIAAGAEVNVNADWNAVTGDAAILNKPSIPTNNNQLTNGAGYQTASDVATAISNAIGNIEGIEFEIVQNLPITGNKGKIYLIADNHGANDSYDEYIWITSLNGYEKIGNTDIDLSSYYNTDNLGAMTSIDIDNICT